MYYFYGTYKSRKKSPSTSLDLYYNGTKLKFLWKYINLLSIYRHDLTPVGGYFSQI